MNYILASLSYVASDPMFWLAMSLVSCIGIFIGAVIYDGILPEAKKGVVVVITYSFLLSMTNASRILPIVNSGSVHDPVQPFAGIATIIFVTAFYIVGMSLGVYVTNFAHGGKHDDRRKKTCQRC